MFIGATALTVFWMLSKYKTSYDLDNDKFHGVHLPHGGLEFKAHRLVHHSTPGSRVITRKKGGEPSTLTPQS